MKSLRWAVAVGFVVASASAFAASKYDDKDNAVFLKGGIGGYTGGLGDSTAAGPTWGVALNLQPTNVFGFEFAYDGSRNAIDDARVSALGNAAAMRHGASALLKVGLPFIERIKPFVGGGLGASYVSIAGETGGLYQGDLMEEVPLVGGIEFNSGVLTAGFRAGYNILVDEGFANTAGNTGRDSSGGLLNMAATLGGRF
jgi:opacity protein-like surface antigen